jgi:hypothetical protein
MSETTSEPFASSITFGEVFHSLPQRLFLRYIFLKGNVIQLRSFLSREAYGTLVSGLVNLLYAEALIGQEGVSIYRDRPLYATAVPVTSCQLWNRWAMTWRYTGAESRWRPGRKYWAIGP